MLLRLTLSELINITGLNPACGAASPT